MIKCSNCGKEISDKMKFCGYCGAKVITKLFCLNCGEEIPPEFSFCANCGTPINNKDSVSVAKENTEEGFLVSDNSIYEKAQTDFESFSMLETTDNEETMIDSQQMLQETSTNNETEIKDSSVDVKYNRSNFESQNDIKGTDEEEKDNTAVVLCSKCNTEVPKGYAFCPKCGKSFLKKEKTRTPFEFKKVNKKEKGATENSEKSTKNLSVSKVKLNFKILIPIVAVVAAILLVLPIGMSLFSSTGGSDYVLYMKDEQLLYNNLVDTPSLEITEEFLERDELKDLLSNSDYEEISKLIGDDMIQVRNNGNRIFFFDHINFTIDDGFTLYYRDINAKDQGKNKVDSDVRQYLVNENGDTVLYLKGDEMSLYKSNLKDKEKISTSVLDMTMSNDGKKLMYLTEDGDLYISIENNEAEKIASDVSDISSYRDDLTQVHYIKDGSLYLYKEGEDKVKIDNDVFAVLDGYWSGEVYYVKESVQTLQLADFVADALMSSDAAMVEPVEPSYYYYNYDNYLKEYEQYQKELELYNQKVARDEIRKEVNNTPIVYSEFALYYFNGTEEIKVAEEMTDNFYSSNGSPVMVIGKYDIDAVRKIDLTKIESVYQVADVALEIQMAIEDTIEQNLVIGDSVIELENADTYAINDIGNTVYYVSDCDEETAHGDLYRIKITDGQISVAELVDEDVSIERVDFVNDDTIMYFKSMNDICTKGDLYINAQKIDFDVYPYRFMQSSDGKLLYITDWSEDRGYGILKMYVNGEDIKIADDVHNFDITMGNEIVYLFDYSMKSHEGTLIAYKDGEKLKIDDEVVGIIRIVD